MQDEKLSLKYGYLLNDSRFEDMKRMALEGKSQRDIGVKYKLSSQYVNIVLRVNGFDQSAKELHELNKVKELSKKGFTLEEISENVKRGTQYIKGLSLKNDIEILTDTEKERSIISNKAANLYKKGYTQKEISRKLNISQTNVSAIVINENVSKKKVPIGEAIKLLNEGYSVSEVSDKLEVKKANINALKYRHKDKLNYE